MRLGRLGQLKNAVTSSGVELGDHPACSIVFKPTTLLNAPYRQKNNIKCSIRDIKTTFFLPKFPPDIITIIVRTVRLINGSRAVDKGQCNAYKCPLN
jgi:hypothetical protein